MLGSSRTPGFWLLLGTPYRGRAIPFSIVTYSSRTIADNANSRNLEQCRAFAEIRALLGENPLVLDREFSCLGLLENLVAEEVNLVIRLHLGSHPPTFINAEGRRIKLTVPRGKKRVYHQLYYKGEVAVNVIGVWRQGFQRSLWAMTNLSPEEGLTIYLARMKLEESLKDLKSLLLLDKVMNKLQENMDKIVALLLMSYTTGLLVGESIRDICTEIPKSRGRQHHQMTRAR
jgi:hypothetical protein